MTLSVNFFKSLTEQMSSKKVISDQFNQRSDMIFIILKFFFNILIFIIYLLNKYL